MCLLQDLLLVTLSCHGSCALQILKLASRPA